MSTWIIVWSCYLLLVLVTCLYTWRTDSYRKYKAEQAANKKELRDYFKENNIPYDSFYTGEK